MNNKHSGRVVEPGHRVGEVEHLVRVVGLVGYIVRVEDIVVVVVQWVVFVDKGLEGIKKGNKGNVVAGIGIGRNLVACNNKDLVGFVLLLLLMMGLVVVLRRFVQRKDPWWWL